MKFKRSLKKHKDRTAKPLPGKPGKPGRGNRASPDGPQRLIGVLSQTTRGWLLQSTNRRERGDYTVKLSAKLTPTDGHLAVAEISGGNRYARECRLLEILGDSTSPRAVSLIAIATHEIPMEFDPAAVAEAEAAQPVQLGQRTDLRKVPLVTIDGPDARDFDDAVFAEVLPDGGWHLLVAIADVAHYVPAGGPLDREAYKRGNSVYFPDRVVPMLPEALSNELCSLKPNVDRASMAAHLWIDKGGALIRWEFVRAVIRSHARLTYEQVQQAVDGQPDDVTAPLLEPVLKPLYAAYRCLLKARLQRGTLELDLPERKVEIGQNGLVQAIKVRERLDSHKLIEEFMIAANVAAAAQLEGKGGVCLYRIHDRPTELKLDALRDFLNTLGISLVPGKQLHPRFLTQILENSAGTPHAQVVNEMMLRSQAQAVYSPANIGHFGLALTRYAHFTSPIRRYADLIVHRGLIRACKLGADGLSPDDIEKLEDTGEHLSVTERRASAAERDAVDRFVTLFMAEHVGATFSARISGVARFGLFARLDETGADGIIPMNSLPDDYYVHDEKKQAMIGRKTKRMYQLAQKVQVKLVTADRLTGSMQFEIVEAPDGKPAGKPKPATAQKPERRERYKRRK